MELFKILRYILFALIFIICCSHQFSNTKVRDFENKYYIISREVGQDDYQQYLNDTTISTDGAHLYKGRKITPFSDNFNDDTGIYLNVNPNERVEIILFMAGKDETYNYAGKVIIKMVANPQEIKVEKSDLEKVLKPSLYKILIIKNNIPMQSYFLFLIY